MRNLAIILLIISMIGCNRKIVSNSHIEKKDSTSVNTSNVSDFKKTEVKDTLKNVALPVEKSANEKLVNQDSGKISSDTSKLETSTAVSWAWIYDGRLFHWIKNKDSLKVTVPTLKTFEKHSDSNNQKTTTAKSAEDTKTITKYVEKQLRWWQKFLIYSGIAAWIFTLVIIFKPKIINRG